MAGNPFRPGAGLAPPHLAGRFDETDRLAAEVAAVKASGVGSTIFMYGPRGMGKTALLGWLAGACGDAKMDVVSVSAGTALKSAEGLRAGLLPEGASLKAKDPLLGDDPMIALADGLAKRARQRPLALLVDEAQRPPDLAVFAMLLTAAQEASRQAPFILALAGTPELLGTLHAIRCTFGERDLRIGVGLIKDTGEAVEAICKPMLDAGIAISAEALSKVAEDSQGYPYFLQEWGQALWNHAAASQARDLGERDLAEVTPSMQARKQALYGDLYQSMESDAELLAAARAVAALFAVPQALLPPKVVHHAIEKALRPYLPKGRCKTDRAWELLDELTNRDFVWQAPDSILMELSIPPLMNYV